MLILSCLLSYCYPHLLTPSVAKQWAQLPDTNDVVNVATMGPLTLGAILNGSSVSDVIARKSCSNTCKEYVFQETDNGLLMLTGFNLPRWNLPSATSPCFWS